MREYWKDAARPVMTPEHESVIRQLSLYPFSPPLRERVDHIYRQYHPYQARDWRIVDYKLVKYPFATHNSRGPTLLPTDDFFVVIGSAATLGSASQLTYGELLARRLGLSCINLGMAGAGPEYFVRNLKQEFWDIAARARFVIVEVMSTTSTSNSTFGVFADLPPEHAGFHAQRLAEARSHYVELARNGERDKLKDFARENTENYLGWLKELKSRIGAPVFGLWFSRRAPLSLDLEKPGQHLLLTQQFPQLVDAAAFRRIAEVLPDMCLAVTDNGMSFAFDRFSQMPTTWWNGEPTQNYYPSPAMHNDAARHLQQFLTHKPNMSGKQESFHG